MDNKEKEELKRSILDMSAGALKERVACEMEKVVENVIDPNTDAKPREINIKIKIKPSEDRSSAAVTAIADSKIRPYTEIPTMLYIGVDKNGCPSAIEATPQTLGQTAFDGTEQDEPKVIDLKTAKA